MPIVSKPQEKAMYAALNGKSTLGISPKVGKKMITDTPKNLRSSLMKHGPYKAPKK